MKQLDLAQLAYEALIEEVSLDYKPGLVCANSNGSHNDMTIETFKRSAKALLPHFRNYQQLSMQHDGTPRELFEKLRLEGQHAEASMFKATHGINTHKGINFIMALLIGSIASLQSPIEFKNIKTNIKQLSSHLMNDFDDLDKEQDLTHGQNLYLKQGVTGIRGEAINGFPILFDYPFSKIEKRPQDDYRFLFGSMANLIDTTILHRAQSEGLHWVQDISKSFNYDYVKKNFSQINSEFIERWISPGGSADFLSAAIFLYKISEQLKRSNYGHSSNFQKTGHQ